MPTLSFKPLNHQMEFQAFLYKYDLIRSSVYLMHLPTHEYWILYCLQYSLRYHHPAQNCQLPFFFFDLAAPIDDAVNRSARDAAELRDLLDGDHRPLSFPLILPDKCLPPAFLCILILA